MIQLTLENIIPRLVIRKNLFLNIFFLVRFLISHSNKILFSNLSLLLIIFLESSNKLSSDRNESIFLVVFVFPVNVSTENILSTINEEIGIIIKILMY